jgi:hypothetical protein
MTTRELSVGRMTLPIGRRPRVRLGARPRRSRPGDEPPQLALAARRPGAGRTGVTLARCRRARSHGRA